MDLSMFKAYDIRTRHEALDDTKIEALSKAIAIYYRDDVEVESVVLGRDARLHCPELMEAIMKALRDIGIDVYINPLQISTCHFYYMCMQRPESGGIMITASHNPGEYVGCKFVGKGATAIASSCGPNGGINRIRQYYSEGRSFTKCKSPGKIHIFQKEEAFIDYSMKLAGVKEGDLKGMKIFAEFFSGSAGMDFAMAFEKAGADIEINHLIPDGYFPAGEPNPVKSASMASAREKMKNGNYDLGFAFDGDGDRMDLMFPDGEQIIPGLNMSILIPYILDIFKPFYGDDYPFKFFSDIKATPIVVSRIAKAGTEPHIIRNGHSFIKGKLHEYEKDGFIASEEESSHYYMNFPYDPDDFSKGFTAIENTIFFALLTAKAYKENQEKYQEIKEIQKNINRYREWTLNFDEPDKIPELLEKIEKAMIYRGATVIRTMDDGTDLDATLFRFNLPVHFTKDTEFPSVWCQVSQRISRSEDAKTRWEVVASDRDLCEETNNVIRKLTDEFAANGWAHY